MLTSAKTHRKPYFLGLDMDEYGNIRLPSPNNFRPRPDGTRPPRRGFETVVRIIVGIAALIGLIYGISLIDWSGMLTGPYLRYFTLGDGITSLKQTTGNGIYLACAAVVVAVFYGNIYIPQLTGEYLPGLNSILVFVVGLAAVKGYFLHPIRWETGIFG